MMPSKVLNCILNTLSSKIMNQELSIRNINIRISTLKKDRELLDRKLKALNKNLIILESGLSIMKINRSSIIKNSVIYRNEVS